mgnify:FL=1
MKEKIAKIGWKNIALVVLAVLLAISVSQLHTLRREYKKVYSQNMELNSKMAELKEKNASLEAQIQSAGEMSSSDTDSASETDDTKDADSASNKDSKTNSDN